MSAQYPGLIAEISAGASIPGKQLEAMMTAYPSCWGYAAPVKDKQGNQKLLMAATKIPDGWSAKDLLDMKAEIKDLPEMLEFYGKLPEGTDDVCMQPFPVLEDDKGNTLLCLFLEGDFDHWVKVDEPHHTPEYICYRDKITPLVNQLNVHHKGNVTSLVKELGSTVYQEILEGTFDSRGVIYFLSNTGASQMIEGGNDKRKDEGWGTLSNEVPEIQQTTDTTVEDEVVAAAPGLSLAEKRKLRQQAADNAAKKTVEGVHATSATRSVLSVKDTTISEQAVRESLKTSTAIPDSLKVTAKGPFLINLPSIIRTVDEAKSWWSTNFGTCPNEYKIKQADGKWIPSYKAGFPYEKLAKGSVLRDKYNPDGSSKSTGKGFAALDAVASGKGTDVATAQSSGDGDTRPASAPIKLPMIPVAVRDKVVEEIVKLDLKSREIMSNEEIKDAEAKISSVYAQLKNITVQDTWRMTFAEIDRLNKTYPDFGSVWLFALRNFQKTNWKDSQAEPKKEETTLPASLASTAAQQPREQVVQPQPELTLAQKRELRKKAANG